MAAQAAFGAPNMGTDLEKIEFVMRECQCDESRAKRLLAASKNDPFKAVSHQQKLAAMLARQGHSRAQSQSPAAVPANRPPTLPKDEHYHSMTASAGSGWSPGTLPARGVSTPSPLSDNGPDGRSNRFNGQVLATSSHAVPIQNNVRIPSSPERPPPPPPPAFSPTVDRRPTNMAFPSVPNGPVLSPTPRNPSAASLSPHHLGEGVPPTLHGLCRFTTASTPISAGGDLDITGGASTVNGDITGDPDIPMTDSPPTPEPGSHRQYDPHLRYHTRSPAAPSSVGQSVEHTIPASSLRSVDLAERVDVEDPLGWDFRLPILPEEEAIGIIAAGREGAPAPAPGIVVGGAADFNLRELCAAVQHGADLQTVQKYLRDFPSAVIKRRINGTVEGVPSIFYAVGTDDPAMLRLWAGYGANISALHPVTGTPLLAYAIALSDLLEGRDTSPMVATLLSLGASPKAIPDVFYTPYNRDLSEDGPPRDVDTGRADEDEDDSDNASTRSPGINAANNVTKDEWHWCSAPAVRKIMARTANLTQRYYLDRATKLKRPGVRHRQIAALRNAEAILGIPYYLIGQTIAANRLLRKLLTYITVPSKKPLVLAFAGPSGHGKTELARKLGYLLGLELQVVDCTIVNQEKELFGPRAPYVGSERGSPLNNFIAQNAGRRSIVFLDEFEKTSPEIHQSLLLPFDNGEYQDRRTLATIDCSRTIWILATNALDETIIQFCNANPAIIQQQQPQQLSEEDKGSGGGDPSGANIDDGTAQRLSKRLSMALRAAFLNRFGAPVTGRVSDFIPFLPFSKGEQAVVVHKFLIELAERVAAPVQLRRGAEEQLLGNVRLQVRRDASVCARLAETEYSEELGARSLRKAVEEVQDRLVESYLDEDKEIEEGEGEGAGLKEYVVDVKGDEVVVSKWVG